jgi:nucleotide-binding universal stress UspA family protein
MKDSPALEYTSHCDILKTISFASSVIGASGGSHRRGVTAEESCHIEHVDAAVEWRIIMFNNILVPTDGSALAEKAVHAAIQFAREHGSEIVALSVAEPHAYATSADGFVVDLYAPAEYDTGIEERARSYVDRIAALAQAGNVPCRTTTAISNNPAGEIIQATRKFRCDVIFMATHGRSWLGRLFAGSETQSVLAHADIPVVVFH